MEREVALLLAYLRGNSVPCHPMKCGWLWRMRNDSLERIWTSLSSPSTLTCSYIAQAASHLGEYVVKGLVSKASAVGPKEARGMTLHGFLVGAVSAFGPEMDHAELYAESPEVMLSWISAIESCRHPSGRPLLIADRYELDLTAPLGTGLFAVVIRGREISSGQSVAVKVIKPEAFREFRPMIQREFCVWSSAGSHPNICGLIDAYTSETTALFVAQLCRGGGLIRWLARSPGYCENDASILMRQILEALDHLHSLKLLHCDLKPENICMATRDDPHSQIRLIDFSMASFFGTPMDPGGTPEFVAPELLDEPELFAQYGCGPSVDMWSAGIVLYFLLSGQTPFSAPTVDAIVQKVQSGLIVDGPKSAFKGASWSDVSDGAFDLIKGLLRSKGQERLSAGEALGHPWIQAGARMALPRRPLEAAKRMFKAQAMQAGDDVSSPFPPTLYSPSLQTTSASTSVRGMHRSQSERSSDSRDSRQKGQPFSNLSSVPEYVEPTNQAMSQILALNRSTSLAPRSDQLNEAYLMSRRSQSSRRDDYVDLADPLSYMHRLGPDPSEKSGRVSLPPWSTLPTESTSTPTRSSVGPPASASQSSAGSSSVIQLLQQELAGLQAEVQAKKRGTQPQVPSTSFASAFAAAPTVPPSFPSSRGPYSNDTDLLGLMGAGPALSNSGAWGETTPQNSSGQLMLNLPPTATSAAPNESILVLQQQLRQLQLMAAEKGNSAVGGSERGQRRRPAPFVSSPSPPLAASSSQRFVVGSERGERRGTEGLSSSIDLL